MRLIIVRHGESEWNKIGRYQGQEDAPLSELGRQQAEALARRLQREKLDAIYVSPLQRAGWSAVRAMVRRSQTNQVMDDLYELGARAILVTSIHASRL